jgi:hypothetical protein
LLFEEGIEDDGGSAGVFELADGRDLLRERGSGGDEGSAKL